MSYVTGLILIDAPASALNNSGSIRDELYGNKVAVKAMRSGGQVFPYVSAQAFRYWLREVLEENISGWKSAPIYREEKVAYTDANPIEWYDDDLFGYMRAPGGGAAKKKREDDAEYKKLTPLDTNTKGDEQAVTRVSPFRVSTLVSIAPVQITEDWESMIRHKEGDAVPYSSQFYRAHLKGLFSLNLKACGTFSYRDKTGFRNLDDVRVKIAGKNKLEHDEGKKTYRLSPQDRIKRISALFEGMSQLEGGAKQSLHYTDVAPALVIVAITKGGNHIFGHVVGANNKGLPIIKQDAFQEALTVFEKEILSTVYVGWVKGYLDEERADFEKFAEGKNIKISHPREAYQSLIKDFEKNESWLD
jgi:CRISPR-associated protein Cst2